MRRIRRIPRFDREWGRLLLSGPGDAPEATDVLLDFSKNAFPIGNEGTMASFGFGALPIGVSEAIPNSSEGPPAVSSEVVDSESVCIAWDF